MTGPVRRVHYFYGQLLTPDDLQAEQDYHREMRYLHNRLLGSGVVHGLGVTVADDSTLIVGPGLAIDRCGRELVLPDEVPVDLSGTGGADGSWDVVAIWAEQPDSFVVPVDDCADEAPFTRWLEWPRLAVVPPGEAPEEAVVIGRVLVSADRATAVELSGRSTWPG